jgi:branched-chain amino acid transport system ATP-binding protein
MLALQNVEAMYKGVILAVKGITMTIPAGTCVALLGANGVGKSTTLKCISGIIRSDDGAVTGGTITFEDTRIDGLEADEIVRKGLSHVLEGRRPLPHLTVEQNLIAGGSRLGGRQAVNRRLDEVFETIPKLSELRKRIAGYLSGGEQQLMVIGRGLMSCPRLMLLDEPSLGLAPRMIEEVYGLLAKLKSQGLALLIVEQNARVALDMANSAYVMEGGRIVMEGTATEIAANEDVQEFYLGLSAEGDRKGFRDVKHYRRRKRWLG